MLAISDLDVSYGRAQVLYGVSFEVPAGGLVCLMGRNGVGKTTTLNAIMGLLSPRSGSVRFESRDITRWAPHQRVRAGIGYVPQGQGCFPQLSVEENLITVAEAAGKPARAKIAEATDLFPRLGQLMKRRAGVLSGGQRQQLAIARTLVTEPRLLLMDEPTEGIQPSIIDEIEETILALKTNGQTILLVEQYVEFALKMADHFVVLDAGRVVRSGAVGALDDDSVRQLLAV